MRLGTLRLHTSVEADELLAHGLPLDTAGVYGEPPGSTEARIGRPAQTKVGLVREGSRWFPDGRARSLRDQIEASRQRLGHLEAVLLHAVDPAVGLARSWAALRQALADGLCDRIGLCNVRHHEVLEVLELGDLSIVQVALSPFDRKALASGVVRLCLENGIEVQAHSPLGGWRRKRRTVPAWKHLDAGHGRLALRWLEGLGVVPVVGCTRGATLEDALQPVPDDVLAEATAAIPESRLAVERPRADGERGHVVMVCGLPAAGKTTAARRWVERGYARLNRDELGGTLAGLVKRLDGMLPADVVLDNTWSERHLRHAVVDAAARHGCRVTVEHVTTDPGRCTVHAVRRILADKRGLPEPGDLDGEPVHWFGPRALHSQVRRWEPPTDDEGFARVELAAPALSWGSGSGTIVDLGTLEGPRLQEPVFAALWAPDPARRARVQAALGRQPVLDHRICTHPAGPPRCWCRKPLPGLVVDLLLTHDLDPARTTLVGGPAERTLAERLGARYRASI